jgi:hypothetical protein
MAAAVDVTNPLSLKCENAWPGTPSSWVTTVSALAMMTRSPSWTR